MRPTLNGASETGTPTSVGPGRPATNVSQTTVLPTSTASELETAIQERATALAMRMVANQVQQTQLAGSGRIFTPFNQVTDVVPNQKTLVTSGLFSNSSASIATMFTSSAQSSTSKEYYYAVYKDNPSSTGTATSQFAIAYGHRLGSGSLSTGPDYDAPSKAIYGQYQQALLPSTQTQFTFGTQTSNDIYAITINRARLKDKLDRGNWELFYRDW